MSANDPQELLRAGDLDGCRTALMGKIKANPGDAKLRAFLFQLMAVGGDWDRAGKQLEVLSSLDDNAVDMVSDYRAAVMAEAVRSEVMAGKRAPAIMGEPSEWIAKLVEALRLDAAGAAQAAYDLRQDAFAEAPTYTGNIDGTPFEWLSDADQRYGPVLEAVLNGEYHWIPFDAISTLALEEPKDLRDMVWTVGILTLANGGQWPVFIPTRYPGSDTASGGEADQALARRTDWVPLHEEHYAGTGQRMLATDADDFPLLNVRHISFDRPPAEDAETATAAEDTPSEPATDGG